MPQVRACVWERVCVRERVCVCERESESVWVRVRKREKDPDLILVPDSLSAGSWLRAIQISVDVLIKNVQQIHSTFCRTNFLSASSSSSVFLTLLTRQAWAASMRSVTKLLLLMLLLLLLLLLLKKVINLWINEAEGERPWAIIFNAYLMQWSRLPSWDQIREEKVDLVVVVDLDDVAVDV